MSPKPSADNSGIAYRPARHKDLPQIAALFFRAFPESVQHVVGDSKVPTAGISDAFAILHDAEPKALRVAADGNHVAGYIFAPHRLSGVWRIAILRGHILRMAWRWVTGAYGIGLRAVLRIALNKFTTVRSATDEDIECDARIFSVAVDPAYQDQGIGTRLIEEGLKYLESTGAERVRLEVRPDNASARHVYEKMGFQTHDKVIEDTQGAWLVMFKDLRPPA